MTSDKYCKYPDHVSHIWPMLPLQADMEILYCEQVCQWCPLTNLKRWESATALRKHARCHLKGSQYNIKSAGSGGSPGLAKNAIYLDAREIYDAHVASIMQIDSARSNPSQVVPGIQTSSQPDIIQEPLITQELLSEAGIEASMRPHNRASSEALQTPEPVSDPIESGLEVGPSSGLNTSTSDVAAITEREMIPGRQLVEQEGQPAVAETDRELAPSRSSSPTRKKIRKSQSTNKERKGKKGKYSNTKASRSSINVRTMVI